MTDIDIKKVRESVEALLRARSVYDGHGMMGGSSMAASAYESAYKEYTRVVQPETVRDLLNDNARLRRELEEAQAMIVSKDSRHG